MENKKDKNIRIGYNVWALLFAKTAEISLRTGKKITIKSYIEKAVKEKLESNPNKI